MSLQDVITQAEQEYNGEYQFDEDILVKYADTIQKMAFTKDLEAFKVWTNYIRVFHTLTFDPDDFSVIASDIGKNVIGATSGAIGELISYDEDETTYLVYVTSGAFEDTEVVAVQAGTGTGTLTSADIFLGPYDLSDVTPGCRKLVGVTTYTDEDIFGATPRYLSDLDDYGMELGKRDKSSDFYVRGRINPVDKTFTFIDEPDLTENYYRWIYYRQAPTIANASDEANLIIPDEFHGSLLLQGMVALMDNSEYGDCYVTPSQLLRPFMEEFWEAMGDQHLDIGDDNHRRLGW